MRTKKSFKKVVVIFVLLILMVLELGALKISKTKHDQRIISEQSEALASKIEVFNSVVANGSIEKYDENYAALQKQLAEFTSHKINDSKFIDLQKQAQEKLTELTQQKNLLYQITQIESADKKVKDVLRTMPTEVNTENLQQSISDLSFAYNEYAALIAQSDLPDFTQEQDILVEYSQALADLSAEASACANLCDRQIFDDKFSEISDRDDARQQGLIQAVNVVNLQTLYSNLKEY